MRIAVCEDDAMECGQFMDALRGWDPTRSAEVFSDGASLLQAAKVSPPFSIAFLDIYLPKENGMDVAAALREISPETELVFVTTSREHAVEAYSLSALHYLVKPVTTEGIREAFRRSVSVFYAEPYSWARRRIPWRRLFCFPGCCFTAAVFFIFWRKVSTMRGEICCFFWCARQRWRPICG